jgi:hypothetical protein
MAEKKRSSGRADGKRLAPRDMAENGRETYGWRVVDGRPALVVVAVGFVVVARPDESFAAFRERTLRFAAGLAELDYPVLSLTFQRREEQRKLPWAEFNCATPEARLPECAGPHGAPEC